MAERRSLWHPRRPGPRAVVLSAAVYGDFLQGTIEPQQELPAVAEIADSTSPACEKGGPRPDTSNNAVASAAPTSKDAVAPPSAENAGAAASTLPAFKSLGWDGADDEDNDCWAIHGSDFSATTTELKGHRGCVNSLEWSLSGETLYSGSDDCHIGIWSFPSMRRVALLRTGHRGNIFCTRVVPGSAGNEIISCGADGQICLTNIGAGTSVPVSELGGDVMAYNIYFLPGSLSSYLCCDQRGELKLFDLRASQQARSKPVRVVLQEAGAGRFRGRFNAGQYGIRSFRIDPTQPTVVSAAFSDSTVHITDVRGTSEPGVLTVESPCSISGLDYSVDGARLAVSFMGGPIVVAAAGEPGVSRPLFRTTPGGGCDEHNGIPAVSLGNHSNEATFLKEPAFAGRRSEWLWHGDDAGEAYCYFTGVHPLRQMDVWKFPAVTVDSRVCNVALPHPHNLGVAACSGIDSTIKIIHHKNGDPRVQTELARATTINLAEAKEALAAQPQGAPSTERVTYFHAPPPFNARGSQSTNPVLAYKDAGVAWLSRGRPLVALSQFLRGMSVLLDRPLTPEIETAFVGCSLNAVLAAQKAKMDLLVLEGFAESTVKTTPPGTPSRAKALFRYAQILHENDSSDKALAVAQKALVLLPQDSSIQALVKECMLHERAKNEKLRVSCAKLFSS